MIIYLNNFSGIRIKKNTLIKFRFCIIKNDFDCIIRLFENRTVNRIVWKYFFCEVFCFCWC